MKGTVITPNANIIEEPKLENLMKYSTFYLSEERIKETAISKLLNLAKKKKYGEAAKYLKFGIRTA